MKKKVKKIRSDLRQSELLKNSIIKGKIIKIIKNTTKKNPSSIGLTHKLCNYRNKIMIIS